MNVLFFLNECFLWINVFLWMDVFLWMNSLLWMNVIYEWINDLLNELVKYASFTGLGPLFFWKMHEFDVFNECVTRPTDASKKRKFFIHSIWVSYKNDYVCYSKMMLAWLNFYMKENLLVFIPPKLDVSEIFLNSCLIIDHDLFPFHFYELNAYKSNLCTVQWLLITIAIWNRHEIFS